MLLGRPVRCTDGTTSCRTLVRCTTCTMLCRRTMCSTTSLYHGHQTPGGGDVRSHVTQTQLTLRQIRPISARQWNHKNTSNHELEVSMGCVGDVALHPFSDVVFVGLLAAPRCFTLCCRIVRYINCFMLYSKPVRCTDWLTFCCKHVMFIECLTLFVGL